jgi:hypothetical protein
MADIYLQFSDCGQHIRKWSSEPFEGGARYRDAAEVKANLRAIGDEIVKQSDCAASASLAQMLSYLFASLVGDAHSWRGDDFPTYDKWAPAKPKPRWGRPPKVARNG